MAKYITFTCSDWVYNTYLNNTGNNRSKYIEELIVKGSELLSDDYVNDKQKLLNSYKKITILKTEIANLQQQISSLKYRLESKKEIKKRLEQDKYSDWDIDNLSSEELDYWRSNMNIPTEYIIGQNNFYNNIFATKISLDEFKRRYNLVRDKYGGDIRK
jgi:hypothetical protein